MVNLCLSNTKNADYERTAYCIVRSSNGSRKTHLALDLLENEYKNHFNFIIIICSTLKHNETYRSRKWLWTDPEVILIEPGNRLYDWIEKIGNVLAGSKTLFLIDDIIADETLDKLRQSLLELELANVKMKLKQGKYTCLIMRMEHPRAYEIC